MCANKNISKYLVLLMGTMISAILMISCSNQSNRRNSSISNGVDIPVMPTTTLISEQETPTEARNFKAIVVDVNSQDKTMVLQGAGTGARIKYEYTGGTDIISRYDEPITIDRLALGEVIEVWTSGSSTKLTKIKISDADFDYGGVTNFKIDMDSKTISVGNERYNYTDHTVVVTQDSEISIDKLDSVDVLRLRGTDKELDSVTVTKGHGYLRLDSTTFFEGGYLEVGDKIIEMITENMVVAVPVGRFNVTVSKDKTAGSREIVISDNEEIRLNLTEFQSNAVRLGALSFKISPKGAKLTVDGVEKDYSQMIGVAYGTHKIIVTADGYEPYAQVITVDSITSEYNIMLVREGSGEDDGQADDTASGAKESDSTYQTGENAQSTTGENGNFRESTRNAGASRNSSAGTGNNVARSTFSVRETTTIPTIDYNSIVSALLD